MKIVNFEILSEKINSVNIFFPVLHINVIIGFITGASFHNTSRSQWKQFLWNIKQKTETSIIWDCALIDKCETEFQTIDLPSITLVKVKSFHFRQYIYAVNWTSLILRHSLLINHFTVFECRCLFKRDSGCILFCTSRRRCHKLANVMAFSEGVQKDIAMCKMQRALQKRMHPVYVFLWNIFTIFVENSHKYTNFTYKRISF